MSAVAHIDEYKTGYYFSDEFRGEMSWNGYENNVLLRNEGLDAQGHPKFVEVAMAYGADSIQAGRGAALFDLDNDGDLDIAINNNPGDTKRNIPVSPTIVRNDVGNRRSWAVVELVGTDSNRDAAGATAIAEIGDRKSMALVSIGSGYASQNTSRLYFGLGDASRIDRLTVRWPSGAVEPFENVPARRLVRITEGQGLEVLPLRPKPVGLARADGSSSRTGQ